MYIITSASSYHILNGDIRFFFLQMFGALFTLWRKKIVAKISYIVCLYLCYAPDTPAHQNKIIKINFTIYINIDGWMVGMLLGLLCLVCVGCICKSIKFILFFNFLGLSTFILILLAFSFSSCIQQTYTPENLNKNPNKTKSLFLS